MKLARMACALALVASSAAHAAPVTFQFTGTVDDSSISGYEVGSLISGQFTYDTDTPAAMDPSSLGDGFQLITYAAGRPDAFELSIGGDVITSSMLNIVILDSDGTTEGGEALSIMADGATVRGGIEGDGAIGLTFTTTGLNTNVLTTALPSVLTLEDFDSPFMGRYGTIFSSLAGEGGTASFTVTSLQTTAVPEVSTAVTMLTGFALMGGLLRRRRIAA